MNSNLNNNNKKNNNWKGFENIIDYSEFYLLNKNTIYKAIIYINDSNIIINCKQYKISLNLNDISKLLRVQFNTLIEAYNFLINKFEENKIELYDIIRNRYMKFILNESKKKEHKIIEIILTYDIKNKDLIFKQINKLQNEIINLRTQINFLQTEYNALKVENKSLKLPKEKNIFHNAYIIEDSLADFYLDKTFCIFKSLNNISYLIYSNEKNLIVSYNLDTLQKIAEIHSNHKKYITNFRHYLDKINNRDLLLSISAKENNIKVWEITYWKCILNISNINLAGFLDSACLLYDNNNFIITSNSNQQNDSEPIKIFDFQGNKVKEINNSRNKTFFIDVYYENNDNDIYIMAGCTGCIKAFNYKRNNLYNIYSENNNYGHISVIVYNYNKVIKLIESCDDGNIRIWNFHSGNLLKKIKVSLNFLYGICLWDNNHIFVGCEDKTIKLVEINKGIIVKSIAGHNIDVLSLDKINLPNFGECLVSQGKKKGQIILWIKNNY